MPRRLRCLPLLALLLAPLSAHAQPSAADRRQAEALFTEAKKLLAAGKVSEACAKFEGSYKIDAAGGTILNLALCHEKEGKIATAWAEMKEALAAARKANRKDREKIAREHIDAIEPRLPYMLVIPDKPDTLGLAITVDEGSITEEAWGAQIPVDPGKHTAKATATERDPWESTFEAEEGKKVSVRIPALAVAAPPPPTVTAVAVSPGGPPLRYPWMRPSGIAIGSVGVAAVVVGAIFGGRALSLGSDAAKECSPTGACSQKGFAAVQDGRSSATAADILLGAGAGFAVVGTILFFAGGVAAPPPKEVQGALPKPRAIVSTNGFELGLEGAW